MASIMRSYSANAFSTAQYPQTVTTSIKSFSSVKSGPRTLPPVPSASLDVKLKFRSIYKIKAVECKPIRTVNNSEKSNGRSCSSSCPSPTSSSLPSFKFSFLGEGLRHSMIRGQRSPRGGETKTRSSDCKKQRISNNVAIPSARLILPSSDEVAAFSDGGDFGSLSSSPSKLASEPFPRYSSIGEGDKALTFDPLVCHVGSSDWLQKSLAVTGSGTQRRATLVESMLTSVDSGLTTFDLSDYGGRGILEFVFGSFINRVRRERGDEIAHKIRGFARWSPAGWRMTRSVVATRVNEVRKRMDVPSVDLFQLHWRDFEEKGFGDALLHLTDLREEGKIRQLAVVGFDTWRLQDALLLGIPIACNVVETSLLTPTMMTEEMTRICELFGIRLLVRGSTLGGLLSEGALKERNFSEFVREEGRKRNEEISPHFDVVFGRGGWREFQQKVLEELSTAARKHGVSMRCMATRPLLDLPIVAGAVLESQDGSMARIKKDAFDLLQLRLDEEDLDRLKSLSLERGSRTR